MLSIKAENFSFPKQKKKKKLRARLFPCQLYHNHEKKGWAKNKDGQGHLRFPKKK